MKLKSTNYIGRWLLPIAPLIITYSLPREECHNATAERIEECHNVDEANALEEEDGWFKVSPYGAFPGKEPGRIQKFGKAEAQLMEVHFNSLAGKLGRVFRGAPIFIGHPDVDRTLWPDERRLGKVAEIQARADGLWARPEWNALGRENIENGYWIYPSPRWDAPKGKQEFRPDRLLSIGLTNMPRIKESDPIANASFAQAIDEMRKGVDQNQDAAAAAGVSDSENVVHNKNPETETSQQTNIMDRKLMIEKLGLPPEATDEEIWAKLDAMLKENADMAATEKAKLDAEAENQGSGGTGPESGKEKVAAAEDDELAKARMETANARVDLAIAEGRIGLSERDAWLGRLTGENRETEFNSLTALKPKLNTGALDLKKARTEIGDEAQRRETIANAVAVEQAKGKTYRDAYLAVQNNPEFKAVFEAMKEPDREES